MQKIKEINIWKNELSVESDRVSYDISTNRKRKYDPCKYEGWYSTFGAQIPAKRGHKRVNYSPYMIGGFTG